MSKAEVAPRCSLLLFANSQSGEGHLHATATFAVQDKVWVIPPMPTQPQFAVSLGTIG